MKPPLSPHPPDLPGEGQWFVHRATQGVCRIVCAAREEASPSNWFVVYTDQASCETWARPLVQFLERFERCAPGGGPVVGLVPS